MGTLLTPRLILEPMTLPLVEAVFRGDREALEQIAGAKIPAAWPGRTLVERAFSASLEAIRADPDTRLWGDRLMINREGAERLVIGSIIFHGKPGAEGIAEVGYGVEESWQRKGVATEGTRAAVEWALEQPGVRIVTATTPPWHAASVRVLEKSGLVRVGTEEHEILGEVLRFERRRGASAAP
ncbi:MAG: acetyltransferase, family [Labilithrix sp.]|nr:acetyltransferase, family [Labilithrix sp.]